MAPQTPTAVLNTGATIPLIGLGCWMGQPGKAGENQETEEMVNKALAANDPQTGKELSPADSPTINETWAEMEKVLATGKVKAIGVSNFSVKTLTQLLMTAKVVPAVNQVESHPYLPQDDLLTFCKEKGIHLTAYSPLGQYNSPLLKDQVVTSIAEKREKEASQVLLSWAVQRGGVSVVPKSSNPTRLAQNLDIFELTADEFTAISALHTEEGKYKSLCEYGGPGVGLQEKGKILGWTYDEMGWDPKAWAWRQEQ
ncbi:hypothetical protein MNV49_001923 [Pseudohyphozyma bogoriensis]|nr:hypothetical protein MNV49_001923 [Pseudohyphozyma bogoriensis]